MGDESQDKNSSLFINSLVLACIVVGVFLASLLAFFSIHLIKYLVFYQDYSFSGAVNWAANDAGRWSVNSAYASLLLPFVYFFEGIYTRRIIDSAIWYIKMFSCVVAAFVVIRVIA